MHEASSCWRGRRVLVTGCTGLLGGAVVEELLAGGAHVVGLVRHRAAAAALARHQLAGRVHIVHGRTEDLFRIHSALAIHEAHAVFHLAACEPLETDPGSAAVFEAVRRFDPRIPTVVARRSDSPPLVESAIPLGVARFGELFGGRETKPSQTPTVSLDSPRDFVHVRDAARACLLLAEAVAGRPIPHVNTVEFRTGWVLTGRALAAAHREGPSLAFPACPENPLGWSPALNFSEAIADTVAWRREAAFPDRPPAQRRAA